MQFDNELLPLLDYGIIYYKQLYRCFNFDGFVIIFLYIQSFGCGFAFIYLLCIFGHYVIVRVHFSCFFMILRCQSVRVHGVLIVKKLNKWTLTS